MTGAAIVYYSTSFVYLVLGVVALGLELWAFVDALRHKPAAYTAAYKRTKTFWMAVTGAAAFVGVLSIVTGGGTLGLFGLAAVTAACVYLADVRPEVKETGKGRPGNMGPYGPW
ncbi:DUF2516 family protein [Pseudarthrobacter sp. J1763]|uniref:DUF2516 family protein n=1 Tax=Pseudarthrobacter sp. J1763 TaxID=3420445 RepID=UPI003D2C3F94